MIYFRRQVDEILKAKDEQIRMCQKEIERLQALVVIERQRSEKAIDSLLEKNGQPPISQNQKSRIQSMFETISGELSVIGGDYNPPKEKKTDADGK